MVPSRRYLTGPETRRRYGRSAVWLWRRLRSDPTFPRPVVIDGHNYFDEAELDGYDADHRAPSLNRDQDAEELTNTANAGAAA